MTEDAGARALLFEGSGRARVIVGDRSWEDVPLVPLGANDAEPIGLDEPALVLRAGSTRATARLVGERHEEVALYLARPDESGNLVETAISVRDVRERKAKGDPFWNRVFRKKE